MFYAGSGLLGLALSPLPAPGADRAAVAAVYATAVALVIGSAPPLTSAQRRLAA